LLNLPKLIANTPKGLLKRVCYEYEPLLNTGYLAFGVVSYEFNMNLLFNTGPKAEFPVLKSASTLPNFFKMHFHYGPL